MGFEIIEAICDYYKDDENTIADCLIYLKDKIDDIHVRNSINQTLDEMNRCIDCGAELEISYYKEWHSEVGASEDLAEIYCPYCGI